MDIIKSLVLVGLIVSFFLGQLFRLNLLGLSFPVLDIFIILFALINFYEHRFQLKFKNKYLAYFVAFSIISFFLNSFLFHYPFLKPLFYLIRLTCLLSFLVYPPKINKYIKYLFVLSIIANILFGLIQYFFWPDFTFFNSQNWDPHLSRLVSTFFDPTFTGLIYLMFLIFIFLSQKSFFLIIISYLALALTYSRSSYLALFITSFFIAKNLKQFRIFIFTSLILLLTIFLLPRPPGEGTKLERTSSIKAKIVNYQEGFSVFLRSPVIGHGYNHLAYVRDLKNPDSHANSGFDGSLMTILTTTGLIGIGLWITGFIYLYQHSTILKQSLLIAIFIHSLFANSLLYPWTLVFFILI